MKEKDSFSPGYNKEEKIIGAMTYWLVDSRSDLSHLSYERKKSLIDESISQPLTEERFDYQLRGQESLLKEGYPISTSTPISLIDLVPARQP